MEREGAVRSRGGGKFAVELPNAGFPYPGHRDALDRPAGAIADMTCRQNRQLDRAKVADMAPLKEKGDICEKRSSGE